MSALAASRALSARTRPSGRAVGWGAATGVSVFLLGAALAVIAYMAGPLVPLAAVVALVVAVVVFLRPMVGVYTAVLAVPLEFATGKFGSSFSLTPTKGLMLLTGCAVGVRLLSSRRRLGIHPAHIAFAGLLAIIALGITAAADALVTERILTVWTAVWLASIWTAGADRDEVQRTMICIAVSGAALGLLALSGAGPQSLLQGGAAATNRATGAFTHPNQLGVYMVLALPITIVVASETRGWLRMAMLLAVPLEVAGLTLTLARAAIFGAIVAGVVLLAWPSYRRVVLAGLALILVVTVVNPKAIQTKEVQTVATRLSTVQNFSQTSGGRLAVWSATPRIIADHPLIGIGEGNFPVVSPTYGVLDSGAARFDHAHDVLLTVAAETGLIGLAFFVWFAASVALAGVRSVLRSDRTTAKLALGLLASYVGIAVISLTDYPLGENADFSVLMIEGALLLALARHSVNHQMEGGARPG